MSTKEATTTLKLDTCSYSEEKIYPGRGSTFVARDGKLHIFRDSRMKSLFHQKVKPAKLTWTQAWRRANRKTTAQTTGSRRKARTTVRVQKAIVGLSLDDIQKKKASANATKPAAPAAADAPTQSGRPPLVSSRKKKPATEKAAEKK